MDLGKNVHALQLCVISYVLICLTRYTESPSRLGLCTTYSAKNIVLKEENKEGRQEA